MAHTAGFAYRSYFIAVRGRTATGPADAQAPHARTKAVKLKGYGLPDLGGICGARVDRVGERARVGRRPRWCDLEYGAAPVTPQVQGANWSRHQLCFQTFYAPMADQPKLKKLVARTSTQREGFICFCMLFTQI